jgi:hypothetical protein
VLYLAFTKVVKGGGRQKVEIKDIASYYYLP